MQTINQYADVVNGVVSVQLPKDFSAKRVKLIIVSADEEETELTDFQKFLLDSPEMTEQELLEINEKRKHFSSWK